MPPTLTTFDTGWSSRESDFFERFLNAARGMRSAVVLYNPCRTIFITIIIIINSAVRYYKLYSGSKKRGLTKAGHFSLSIVPSYW